MVRLIYLLICESLITIIKGYEFSDCNGCKQQSLFFLIDSKGGFATCTTHASRLTGDSGGSDLMIDFKLCTTERFSDFLIHLAHNPVYDLTSGIFERLMMMQK